MEIYHVNFTDKTCIKAGCVILPQDIPVVDMVIEFKPEEDGGTVTICNTDQVWSYTVKGNPQKTEKNQVDTAGARMQTQGHQQEVQKYRG